MQIKYLRPSVWHEIKASLAAALAAMFGVQSKANMQVHAEQASLKGFVIVGVIMTAIFVGSLIGLVTLITKV